MSRPRSRTTSLVRAGVAQDHEHGAVMPPIYLSSNFTFEGFARKRPYDYSRTGNPTRDQLAGAIADLEGGAGAVVTSSGMAAVALVLQVLEPGDLVVASPDVYGGTHRLLTALQRRRQIDLCFAELYRRCGVESLRALRPRLIWVETPSNPLLRITDLEHVCALARQLDALVAVDGTLLSPALQRPIELGADLVVHSTTKFLNGHSDVVGGVVVAARPDLAEQLAWWGNCLGVTGAPFDAYLTLRGLRTLAARTRVHGENAARVVEALAAHEAVECVHYPGLASHPGHDIAARQQLGFGSMVSVELRDGIDVAGLLGRLRCFSLAESLGGVESLIAHPATMTHAAMPAEARAAAGITDSLLRLSVGIEDADDLVSDLTTALNAAVTRRSLRAGP